MMTETFQSIHPDKPFGLWFLVLGFSPTRGYGLKAKRRQRVSLELPKKSPAGGK